MAAPSSFAAMPSFSGLLGAMETLQFNIDEALRLGVFGAPAYLVGNDVFWGQDRLAHLDAHLAGGG